MAGRRSLATVASPLSGDHTRPSSRAPRIGRRHLCAWPCRRRMGRPLLMWCRTCHELKHVELAPVIPGRHTGKPSEQPAERGHAFVANLLRDRLNGRGARFQELLLGFLDAQGLEVGQRRITGDCSKARARSSHEFNNNIGALVILREPRLAKEAGERRLAEVIQKAGFRAFGERPRLPSIWCSRRGPDAKRRWALRAPVPRPSPRPRVAVYRALNRARLGQGVSWCEMAKHHASAR
jgi:hypothetical protein